MQSRLISNIVIFYNPTTDPTKRKSVDKWLNNFQMTKEAWEISLALLVAYSNNNDNNNNNNKNDGSSVNGNISENFLYFAANTLHKKSRLDGGDLNDANIDTLRRSLLELILQTANKNNVRNRLCLAYMALSVHKMALHPDEHPLKEIFQLNFFDNTINKVYQKNLLLAGVELFTVLLEEATADALPVKEEIRDLFIAKARMYADNILQFLNACIEYQMPPPVKVFACLKSWITYGEITPKVLGQSPLLKGCFIHLATDTITEILRCYNKIETDAPVIQAMIPLVMSLSDNIQTNSFDKVDSTARILTSMGGSYMHIICGAEDIGQERLISVLCNCVKHEDIEIAKITLPFWDELKYYLVDRTKRFKAVDDKAEEIRQISEKRRNEFSKYVLQVFDVCLIHLNSIIKSVSGNEIEEEDDIREFGECTRSCAALLGWQPCLKRGFDNLTNILQKEITTTNTMTPSSTNVNAYTLAMKAIHVHSSLRFIYYILKAGRKKEIISEETVLPTLLNSIIPETAAFGKRVVKIGLEIIGIAAFWINARPSSLNVLFPFIVNSLSLPDDNQPGNNCDISGTAAYVLGDICRICANSMPPAVLTVYDSIGQHGLEVKDEVYVIEGMSAIVSNLSFDQAGKGLERLLTPMVNDLCSAIEKNNVELVVRSLEHMVAVFKYAKINDEGSSFKLNKQQQQQYASNTTAVNMQHPVLVLMNNVWNIFEQVIVKFYQNEKGMEKLCRVYKHSIRNAKNHFLPLLEKILNQMVEVFSKCPIPSFLYTCSICVGEFGTPSRQYNTFQVRLKVFQTYRELTKCMCQHLPSIESFISNPCLVEDYFNLSNRVCNKANDFFLNEDNKDVVSICIKLGCVGLRLDHPEAWPTVSCFFHSFLKSSEGKNGINQQAQENIKECFFEILQLHCKEIVRSLIYSIADGINPRFIDDMSNDNVCISELFYALLRINPNIVCNIINECGIEEEERRQKNDATERIIPFTTADRNDFFQFAAKLNASISTNHSDDDAVKDVYTCVWEFHCLCRDKKWKFKRDSARIDSLN